MSVDTNSASEICWNLNDLFAGLDDPRIEETLQSSKRRAEQFQRTYQGKIDSPGVNAQTLVASIREYESIAQESSKPGIYANLRFAAARFPFR
jgi:oligoendopeptidase F